MEEKRGILSTANFTTEAFTHPEIGVRLLDAEVEELFNVFVAAWWELGERELLQPGVLTTAREITPSISDQIMKYIRNLNHFTLTHPIGISTLRDEIRRLIRESRGDIIIATYGISDDDPLYNEMESILEEGKSIRFIVRPRQKTTPILHRLSEKGAQTRAVDWLHAKVVATETANGTEALVMTANLEKTSLQEGFEVGLLLKGPVAEQVLKVLNHWWDNANWEYSISKKLGEHLGAYLVLDERNFEKHEVEESKTIPLGEQVVGDLAILEDFKPDFPEVDDAQRVEYTWTTIPRELPNKCKQHKIEGFDETIRVWRCDKNRIFISVSNQEELEKVLKITEKPKAPIVYHKD